MDCWLLVREFYKLAYSKELPLYFYSDPCSTKEIEPIVNKNKPRYKKVALPSQGDIILIRIFGAPAHLGIYINSKSFLHTQKGTGSIVDSLAKWKNRIVGYYRYD